ncbi:MAG: hypothetical protein ACOH1T_08580 [Microbacteriaceae bacterium]
MRSSREAVRARGAAVAMALVAFFAVGTISPAAAAPAAPAPLIVVAKGGGKPAFGAMVSLYEISASGAVASSYTSYTNIRGEASFPYPKPGAKYAISVGPSSSGNSEQGFDARDFAKTWLGSTAAYQPLAAGTFAFDAAPTVIEASLLPSVTIVGTIDHPVGNPVVRVADTRVDNHIFGQQLFTWFDGTQRTETLVTATTPAGDGTYSLAGLAPGMAIIGVVPSNDSGYGPVYNGSYSSRDQAALHPFAISAGTNSLNQHLGGNGRLSGRLSFEGTTGRDFSFYPTNVEAVSPEDPSTVIESVSFPTGSGANPNGYFTFRHLTAGTYLLRARLERQDGAYLSTWFGGRTADTATPIIVTDGETTETLELVIPKDPAFPGFQLTSYRSPYIDLNADASHDDPYYGVKVGDVLHVSGGRWQTIRVSGMDVSLRYQWTRHGIAIDGATGATHTVTAADAGEVVGVTVVAYGAGFKDSEPMAINPVIVKSLGTITGIAVPAVTSTSTTVRGVRTDSYIATPGTWSEEFVAIDYTWRVDGVVSSNHTASFAYQGSGAVVLTVLASRDGYVTGRSAPLIIRKGTIAPSVVGKRVVDQTRGNRVITSSATRTYKKDVLTASVDYWVYADSAALPGAVTYQWQRSSNKKKWISIPGAISQSYSVTARDTKRYLRVVVKAQSAQYPVGSTLISAGFVR